MLEAFLGKTFIQGSGTNEGLPDPGPEAAKVIERAYDQLSRTINQQLTAQIFYKPLYDGLTLRWNKQTQNLEINADGLIQYLQKQYAVAPVNTQILLYEFAATLNTQGEFEKNILDILKTKGNPEGQGLQRDLSFISRHAVYGTQASDRLVGIRDQNNLILGDSGDDTLSAGNKNDILIGGRGNDILNLGYGQHTVIYNLGDGKDIIHTPYRYEDGSQKNHDILKLGEGISSSTTQLRRGLGWDSKDLTLIFKDSGQVTMKRYFDADYTFKTIQFADGTQWDRSVIRQTLNLGYGQHTIIYNLGDGKDIIHTPYRYKDGSQKNHDILKLGEGISSSTTQLRRGLGWDSKDLTLVFKDSGQVTLKRYFDADYTFKTIQFADGTKWHAETVTSRLNTQNPARHARMVSQDVQVDQLIHAMAVFTPSAMGETSVLPDPRVTTTFVLAVS